jgi:hypothetical protein
MKVSGVGLRACETGGGDVMGQGRWERGTTTGARPAHESLIRAVPPVAGESGGDDGGVGRRRRRGQLGEAPGRVSCS